MIFLLTSARSAWPVSREACNEGEGDPPLYVNVNMFSGQLMNTWIDSLQAFFPGLQVLSTRVCWENAIIAKGFCGSLLCYDTRAFPGSSGFGRVAAQYVLIILFVR